MKTTALFTLALLGALIPLLTHPRLISAQENGVPEVVVAPAQNVKWFDTIEALGTLRANETVVLTASVTDTITKIHFEDGQKVEAGFVLAEMTDQEESALVNEMTAREAEAQRQFERIQNLAKTGGVSESLYDQREREYRAASAQLEAMKSRLQDRLITAPFSGVIGLRNISVGALVEPGDEIAVLQDTSVLKLDFSVPSVFLPSLEQGLPIVASTSAYPDKQFDGKVASINTQVDPVTRSLLVRALIPNEEGLLKPGLLMSVTLRYKFRDAIIIPEEALIPRAGKNEVFVFENGLTQKREVTTGTRRSGDVEIVSGLEKGEMVVTHGTQVARPGGKAKVRTVQEENDTTAEVLERSKRQAQEDNRQ